jgi:hypothetical protein
VSAEITGENEDDEDSDACDGLDEEIEEDKEEANNEEVGADEVEVCKEDDVDEFAEADFGADF